MLLLPGAERERRALLLGAALAAGAALSWWPLAGLDAWIARRAQPVSGLLAEGAGLLARGVTPPHSVAPVGPPAIQLAELESQTAAPTPLSGLLWLEVPVLRAPAGGTELLIAAGSQHGLAPGMPVVWGGSFVGRVSQVSATEARVLRPSAADERTGVQLSFEGAEDLAAIAIGRGGDLPPVLNWLEAGPEPVAGAPVFFRGRRSDPPALANAGFLLGRVARRGEAARGDQAWVLEETRPESAEGRVFVAAGALPAEPIVMPAPERSGSRGILLQDGVLGGRLSAWQAPADFEPGVLLRADRVQGPVVALRGGLAWVRSDRLQDWEDRALVVLDHPLRLALPAQLPPDAQGSWFTRGGDGIPRGLWLGRSHDAPAQSGTPILLRAPLPRGEFP